ncbi:MAG: hypothetical protein JXX29_04425 [Deltaproteobacteria bacterium]|nr:hypothetical protein [Deltaproteobacteria bacterium]MBN2670890.1 hypothetical protein [Deltaproteobacteria bacterium]
MTKDNDRHSEITRIGGHLETQIARQMTYTNVTTKGDLAAELVHHILVFCQRLIPDKPLTIEDLITICHAALDTETSGVRLMEGKFMRGRISEQLSRSRRYGETFSMLAIKLASSTSSSQYEALIDVLRERLRTSDLVFTFKHRIILLLPHIDEANTNLLIRRVKGLVDASFRSTPILEVEKLCFPNPGITRSSQVLDWAEDQLR